MSDLKTAATLALDLATMHHTDEGFDELRSKVRVAVKEALAKQEQELALQKLHDENERLGLYKDAYGEEHKESVRLQCVVCNTVYADGVPPQVAKQEQSEPVGWPCLIAEVDFSQDTVTLAMQCTDYKVSAGKHWLCTTPQSAQKPLTDEQIKKIWGIHDDDDDPTNIVYERDMVRAIEAAHGIKENT